MAKFEEVLPALREGKKIRRSCWGEFYYIFYKIVEDCIVNDKDFYFTLKAEDMFKDDWEIIEEPKPPRRFEFEQYIIEKPHIKEPDSNGEYQYSELSRQLGHFSSFNTYAHKPSENINQKVSKWKIIIEELPDEN